MLQKFPSVFEFSDGMEISNILKSSEYLLDKTYPFFGVVIRKSNTTNIQKIIPFNPSLILSKVEDFKLQISDKIILFNTNALNTTLKFLEKNEIKAISLKSDESEVNKNFNESMFEKDLNLKSENIDKLNEDESDNKSLQNLAAHLNDNFSQEKKLNNAKSQDIKMENENNELKKMTIIL